MKVPQIPRPVAGLLPRQLKHGAGRIIGEIESASVARELGRVAASGKDVIVGPWLGEVGFEILYWVPFLAKMLPRFGIDRQRVVALSRGGPEAWYRSICARYADVLDVLSPAEFKERNAARLAIVGEQKQTRLTDLDRALAERVREDLGLGKVEHVYPALMYRVFQPFWWGHVSTRWIARHTRYARLDCPPMPAGAAALPRSFVAAKFYFNDCFPATSANRAFVSDLLHRLDRHVPVVSLSTGLCLDDHADWEEDSTNPLRPGFDELRSARTNLDVQTAIVGRAQAFVGTYGGFAYLAPFCGVPSVGLYSDPRGFARSHLTMAQSAIGTLGSGSLAALDVAAVDPDRLIRGLTGGTARPLAADDAAAVVGTGFGQPTDA